VHVWEGGSVFEKNAGYLCRDALVTEWLSGAGLYSLPTECGQDRTE
jgi:hypothetical protein